MFLFDELLQLTFPKNPKHATKDGERLQLVDQLVGVAQRRAPFHGWGIGINISVEQSRNERSQSGENGPDWNAAEMFEKIEQTLVTTDFIFPSGFVAEELTKV